MRKYGANKPTNITIFALITLCLSFFALIVNSTISYFVDESITSNNSRPSITLIGTLDLEVTTNFDFKNLVLAPDTIYTEDFLGQDIGTKIIATEKHDIYGAYVRVKFETTRKNVGEEEFVDNSDLLKLYFEEDALTTSTTLTDDDKDKWFYNETDGYYYWIGVVTKEKVVEFNSGYKTTNRFTNVEKNAEVSIDYTVEAIQRQYDAYVKVWETAPDIFVEWAIEDKEAEWGQQ